MNKKELIFTIVSKIINLINLYDNSEDTLYPCDFADKALKDMVIDNSDILLNDGKFDSKEFQEEIHGYRLNGVITALYKGDEILDEDFKFISYEDLPYSKLEKINSKFK